MTKQFYNIKTIAPLNDNVVAIWSSESRQPHPITPDLLLPDGYVRLLFIISGGYKRRRLSTKHNKVVMDQSVIIGMQDSPVMSQNIGALKSIGIHFDPMQFYLLFGDLGVTARNAHTPICESGQDGLIQLDEKIVKSASVMEALAHIEHFFANYIPNHSSCDTWESTQNYLDDLRHSKGSVFKENKLKSSVLDSSLLRSNLKKFTGFTLEEIQAIGKTTSAEIEFPLNESPTFLSIKNLLSDIDENQEDELF